MPRVVFIPGEEALAADIQLMSDATVARFDSEAQRDAAWPVPFDGALCWIEATATLEQYRVTADATGGEWYWLLQVDNEGVVAVRNHVDEAGVNLRYQSMAFQYPGPGDYRGDKPAGTKAEVGNATTGNLGQFRVQQFVEGSQLGKVVIAAAGNTTYLRPANADADGVNGVFGWNLQGRAATNDDLPTVYYQDNIGGMTATWIVMSEDISNAGRAQLRCYGKVYADNVPPNLLERLAAVETRLGIEVAPLAAELDTRMGPTPISTDPAFDPQALEDDHGPA